MTKKSRPSINDQLAKIAAQATTNVTTLSRDNATTLQRDDAVTSEREHVPVVEVQNRQTSHDNVVTSETAGPEGYKRRVRYEKPHASIYAHPKVFKALREIAVAQDCKPHDLYLEGLRLVLRQHGRDFDTLNRGE